MYNNGTYYGNSSNGYSYSPDRSRDVDRYNPSTKSNYTYFDPCRRGYYSPVQTEKQKVNNFYGY